MTRSVGANKPMASALCFLYTRVSPGGDPEGWEGCIFFLLGAHKALKGIMERRDILLSGAGRLEISSPGVSTAGLLLKCVGCVGCVGSPEKYILEVLLGSFMKVSIESPPLNVLGICFRGETESSP